jgi:hypothetical protein
MVDTSKELIRKAMTKFDFLGRISEFEKVFDVVRRLTAPHDVAEHD